MRNVFLVSIEGVGLAIMSGHCRGVNDQGAWEALGAKCGRTADEARALCVDRLNRPYWLMEVLASAPPEVHQWASDKVRVVRME